MAETSLNAQQSGLDHGQVTFWHPEERTPPSWAVEAQSVGGFRTFTTRILPPLHEGVKSRMQTDDHLDLVPRSWINEKKQRMQRRKTMKGVVAILAIWLLIMGALLGRTLLLQSRVRDLRESNLNSPMDQVSRLAEQVQSLLPFTDRRTSALNSLLQIAGALPGNGSVVLTEFRYEKGGQISCGGRVNGPAETFNQFLASLTGHEDLRVERYNLRNTSDAPTFQVDLEWRNGTVNGEVAP
jgi:hypothetical protein